MHHTHNTSTAPAACQAASSDTAFQQQLNRIGIAAQAGSGNSSGVMGLWMAQTAETASTSAGHGVVTSGAVKYPSYVDVTLACIPRPSNAVVVTDLTAGIRPALPAGYGSGFEIGKHFCVDNLPSSLLSLVAKPN